MLHPEKIWHEYLTDLSTSLVWCSYFTLGNSKKGPEGKRWEREEKERGKETNRTERVEEELLNLRTAWLSLHCVRYTSIESSVGNAEYYRKYCSPQRSDSPWYFNVLRSDPLRKAIVLQKLLVQFEANFHVLNFHFRTPGHSGSIASPTGQPVHRWKNRSINASRGCRGC